MNALQAIVLGLVQGLTEFLPISSSGHLRIVPAFFGWEDPGAAFTAVIQLGTMAAVLLYFRRDLWNIARAWLRSLRDTEARATLEARLGWFIVLGTVPISIIGLVGDDDHHGEDGDPGEPLPRDAVEHAQPAEDELEQEQREPDPERGAAA